MVQKKSRETDKGSNDKPSENNMYPSRSSRNRTANESVKATKIKGFCPKDRKPDTSSETSKDKGYRSNQAESIESFESEMVKDISPGADFPATEKRRAVCFVCNKEFKRSNKLKLHMGRVHVEEKTFKCNFCPVYFNKEILLTRHHRIHTGENPRMCKICHKIFQQAGALPRHMRVHTGERPFSCKVCGEAFRQNYSLTVHMKSHSRGNGDNQTFQCHLCEKTYTRKSTLKAHVRSHEDDRRYLCYYCGKTFLTGTHLTIHLRTHTKEKPYACSICGRRFSQKTVMVSHMKTIHSATRK